MNKIKISYKSVRRGQLLSIIDFSQQHFIFSERFPFTQCGLHSPPFHYNKTFGQEIVKNIPQTYTVKHEIVFILQTYRPIDLSIYLIFLLTKCYQPIIRRLCFIFSIFCFHFWYFLFFSLFLFLFLFFFFSFSLFLFFSLFLLCFFCFFCVSFSSQTIIKCEKTKTKNKKQKQKNKKTKKKKKKKVELKVLKYGWNK